MEIIRLAHIKSGKIDDRFVIYHPTDPMELSEMYGFRYKAYLRHGYINANCDELDFDEYDGLESTVNFVIKSLEQNRILGCIRIIRHEPLPIIRDCFDFYEPKVMKSNVNNRAEFSRLIIEPYSKLSYLPRHLLLYILIRDVIIFCKKNDINVGYAFIKIKFFIKLKKIFFPLVKIMNYKLKYDKGVLLPYFRQPTNPVIPVYFKRNNVTIFLFFWQIFFNKYIYVI